MPSSSQQRGRLEWRERCPGCLRSARARPARSRPSAVHTPPTQLFPGSDPISSPWSLRLPHLSPTKGAQTGPPASCSSYRGAGVSAGFPPRPCLQGPRSPLCHHLSRADGSREPSKAAPGPPSAPNLLLLGRSPAGHEKAAVGRVRQAPSALLLATGLSSPHRFLSHLDVSKDPDRKCFLKHGAKREKKKRDLKWGICTNESHQEHSRPCLWKAVTSAALLMRLPPV